MTISQLPERTAPDSPHPPVHVAEALRELGLPVTARVSSARCRHCKALPGDPCAGAEGGMHLARYVRAWLRKLISMDEAAAAIGAAGDVFTAASIIPADRPESYVPDGAL